MGRGFRFWWGWLVALACAALVFGLAMVLLPETTQRLFDSLYLSSPEGSRMFGEAAVRYIKFVSAILGAVMSGWAAALLYALFVPFRRGQAEGWRLVAVALVVWFVPDTGYSLWSGFWQNAVLNTVALALFALPLAMTYRTFHAERTEQPHRADGPR